MEENPDIDIDESNLVYPRIENIYSDVNIKTELVDTDEDGYDLIEIAESSNDYYMSFPNKIILGSKPSTLVQSEPTPGPSTASDNWESQDNLYECIECNIVFPTQNELDSHKMASHSYLVARPMSRTIKIERKSSASSVSSRSFVEDLGSPEEPITKRQKAVKSTTKSALNKTFPISKDVLKNVNQVSYGDISPVVVNQKSQIKHTSDNVDRLLCKHCDVRFPDEIALIKHTYELLPDTKFECDICQTSFESKLGLRGHRACHFRTTGVPSSSNDSQSLMQCLYCTCFQTYTGHMKKHLMNNHKVSEFAVKYTKFTGKCAVCSKSMESYKQYNSHVMKIHHKTFTSKTPYNFDGLPIKMKCLLCGQIFTSRYLAYKHKAEKHSEHSQKQTFYTVYDKPIKQLPANSQSLKAKLQVPKNLFGNKTYIPKQNLFKCNKCQIHFVSCSAAFAHSRRCSLAKGDWKCNKCRRTFTKTEKFNHTQQHLFSEKFKVHIVCDKILSKVLCRCPKCELHFDEIAFGDHISTDCVPINGLDCNSCNLKIHSDSYAKHRRYHSKYNFTSGDFILIEFIDASNQNPDFKQEGMEHKQKLMYCSNCTCHFYRIKSKQQFHLERRCDTINKRCCTICGLSFTQKPYMKHMRYDHETLKLKLDDIKFVRIQDSKAINPVMPNFYQCTRCAVRFISPVCKNNHSCSKQVFIKCPKCSQKYDSVTYDIHLTFHNYRRGKTQVASSNVLKFYSCVACNYGFNSYDNVVDHCQKHYINSEELVTKFCKICKLRFADDHRFLHANRPAYEIFKFDYEKLLNDDWLSGFGFLGKDEIEDILSKSVYGTIRNVRLELLVEGPAERTLYKCAQCELNFDQELLLEHTTESCSSSPHFDCTSCTAVFRTRIAKNNHMNIHVIYGDDITFREIIFNYKNDEELNEALRTGRQKESLKFRKCQQCNLLIKKSDYQAHVSEHGVKSEIKQFTFRRNKKLLTYKLFKPANAAKKLYVVYKCRLCKACIMSKANMVRHTCAASDRYEKCSKCLQYFLAWNLKRHIAQHSIIPKFVPKNICVLEFEIMEDSKNFVKKRRRYSSDDDASAGSGVNIPVSKSYHTRKVTGRPYSDNLSEDSQDNVFNDASIESPTTSNAYAKKYIKKSCFKKVDDDNVKDESTEQIECIPEKVKEHTDSTLDIEKWRVDMRNKLYQCDKCYLCFVHKQLLITHISECDDNNMSETPLVCERCDIVFHPSLISFHEKLHDLVRQNPIENYFYLINILTNGVKTDDYKRWLYKCKLCDIQYLTMKTLEKHFSSNHKLPDYLNCEICRLRFSQISRTKHMRIHHNEGKLSKDDLHIEIIQKKTVGVGEIRLIPFVKTHSINNTTIEEVVQYQDESSDGTIEGINSTDISKSIDVNTKHIDQDSNITCLPPLTNQKEVENFIDTDTSNVEFEKIDHHLYQCDKCPKHYLTKLTLVRHTLTANHKGKDLECGVCGLFFGRRTLLLHKSKQHEELKLGRDDFVITNLNINKNNPAIKQKLINSGIWDTFHDYCKKTDITEGQTDNFSENCREIDIKAKSGVSGAIDNRIYKCVECSVHYTNKQTLLLHIVLKKHKQAGFLRCDICGLLFGKGSLQKHISVQHQKLNLSRKDFIINDVFGSQLNDENDDQNIIENASSNNNKLDEVLENKFVMKKETKIFKLYQCKDCKICVQNSGRKYHVCCSDIQKKYCIQCCLSFRHSDVIQHMRLHRKYRDLSRKNFLLIRFGRYSPTHNRIYKCVSCSTHFMSLDALQWHMNALNHQTKRDYCNHCKLFFGKYSLSRHIYVHHKKLNLTVDQYNIIYVSDAAKTLPEMESGEKEMSNLNNSINTTGSEPESTPNVKTVKKLFKCVECDVYLLTRASYYHHIYKHRKLDATEYIDCNICDFQFLNESLGIHMKSHKDKSFCLEKLLIEEYQPNSTESPKIEFYFAKDSLNSKLVTTTTPFDNDDDTLLNRTDEQLSIIDSTSDGIPKASASEALDVDASSYPLNSGESHIEDTLNPTVELPMIDVCAKVND